MAQKAATGYGQRLPVGTLGGEIITQKMLKKKTKISQKVLEFLNFCESLNRGKA